MVFYSPGNPWSQSGRRKGTLRWEGFAEKESFKYALISHAYINTPIFLCVISIMYINFFMIPVRGPHQSEALGGCLVCLCLRPALKQCKLLYWSKGDDAPRMGR